MLEGRQEAAEKKVPTHAMAAAASSQGVGMTLDYFDRRKIRDSADVDYNVPTFLRRTMD